MRTMVEAMIKDSLRSTYTLFRGTTENELPSYYLVYLLEKDPEGRCIGPFGVQTHRAPVPYIAEGI